MGFEVWGVGCGVWGCGGSVFANRSNRSTHNLAAQGLVRFQPSCQQVATAGSGGCRVAQRHLQCPACISCAVSQAAEAAADRQAGRHGTHPTDMSTVLHMVLGLLLLLLSKHRCVLLAPLQVLKATGSEDVKYPHPFDLRVRVQLSNNSLTQELAVTNTGQVRSGGAQQLLRKTLQPLRGSSQVK